MVYIAFMNTALLLLATACLRVDSPALAQTPAILRVNGTPVLVCNEPMFDFGRVRAGTRMEHAFAVTNVSGATVWVRALHSCSCTGPLFDRTYRVDAGETVSILATMGTTHSSGPVSRNVYLSLVPEP